MKKFLHVIVFCCFVACILAGCNYNNHSDSELEFEQLVWPNYENAKQIPIPKSTMADVRNMNDVQFDFYLADTTVDDYKSYVEDCKKKGFDLDAIEKDYSYHAFNSSNYELTVQHQNDNIMYVCVVEERIDIEIKLRYTDNQSADMYDISIYIDDYWEEDSNRGNEVIVFDSYLKEGEHSLLVESDDDADINGISDFAVSKDSECLEFVITCSENEIIIQQISAEFSEVNNDDENNVGGSKESESNADNVQVTTPITVLGGEPVILNPFTKHNFTSFKEIYENSLIDVFQEHSWELIAAKYPELIPDDDKESYKPDRINQYDVFVYLKGDPLDGAEMYDAIIDVRCKNNYLLSNTYEILSEGSYVDNDCDEKGFHQVNTIIIFEDGTEYKIDYRSLFKDDEVIYKQDNSSDGSSTVYPFGDVCGYPGCDHNRAEGKPYCHQHKCSESGCNNSTDLLPDYCDQHNCTYGSCMAPRYKAAGSSYCQRHYIENN